MVAGAELGARRAYCRRDAAGSGDIWSCAKGTAMVGLLPVLPHKSQKLLCFKNYILLFTFCH